MGCGRRIQRQFVPSTVDVVLQQGQSCCTQQAWEIPVMRNGTGQSSQLGESQVGKWAVPYLTQEAFSSPMPWALLTGPWRDSSPVSFSLSLCFLLCFQGERGMPGLPGRHGTKVPCKQWSDACLPVLTYTTWLSLMHKHHLDLCVCLLVNYYPKLKSFCFWIAK